jgi:hypothetical protein
MLDATLEAFRNFVFAPLAADKCAEVTADVGVCAGRATVQCTERDLPATHTHRGERVANPGTAKRSRIKGDGHCQFRAVAVHTRTYAWEPATVEASKGESGRVGADALASHSRRHGTAWGHTAPTATQAADQ